MRNVLRWAGSKRQLLPTLASYWMQSELRYVEPFAGSAALFFHLRPERALLGDINGDLIGFYNAVKLNPKLVYDIASQIAPQKETYYQIRKNFTAEADPITRAAYFLYLNRYCFNGIYRTNMKGEFNVPFSGSKTGNLPSWPVFAQSVDQLDKATIERRDFEELLLENVNSGDFIYLDPPYAVSSHRVFSEYGSNSFSLNDLPRLQRTLVELDSRGARFVLSYAFSKESQKYFGEWKNRRVICQRNVAGFTGSRRKAVETIVTNFEI